MTNDKSFINKQIPPSVGKNSALRSHKATGVEQFLQRSQVFEIGDQALANSVPFSAIDFDTLYKGDTFILSYGSAAPLTTHSIAAPAEVWQTQDENGVVVAFEIIDIEDRKTIIKFE